MDSGRDTQDSESLLQIARSEPLERVEKLFRNYLLEIQPKYTKALSPITLNNVSKITPFYVTLSISTSCREEDRSGIEYELMREFELFMAINCP